jgi:hypothetical protein
LTTTRSTILPLAIAKDSRGSRRARTDHVRRGDRRLRLGVLIFFDYRSGCAHLLHKSNPESGVSTRGIGHQWVRSLHQPQEHPEHLVARSAHPDRATAFTIYSILTIQHLTIVTMLNAYLLFRFFRDRAVP